MHPAHQRALIMRAGLCKAALLPAPSLAGPPPTPLSRHHTHLQKKMLAKDLRTICMGPDSQRNCCVL
jgi:hypothetical protein